MFENLPEIKEISIYQPFYMDYKTVPTKMTLQVNWASLI